MRKIRINPISLSSIQLPTAIPVFTPLELASLFYIPFAAKNLTVHKSKIIYVVMILILISAQLATLAFSERQVNFSWFAMKYILIAMCFSLLIIVTKLKYELSYFYLRFSLVTSVILGLALAPSYIFFGQSVSEFGICSSNNLFLFTGHLRCSTFGEGNYFGIYLSTILLLFHRNNWIILLCTIGMCISMSKTGIFILGYILIRKFLKIPFIVMAFTIFIIFLAFIEQQHIHSLITGEGIPQRTSFGERLEFIRIGIRAFLDHPFFGVGAGQFHLIIAEYTDFPHLLSGSNMPTVRFISNNITIELLSEFGLIGFLVFLILLLSLSKSIERVNKFSRTENLFIIMVIGLAQPTFFILSNFVIYGVAIAGGNRNN